MSFRYKNNVITLENYRSVFNVCTPDVLDEIRSAILDDTPIAQYIKLCGNDSYKLGQLRLATRELVPKEFLSPKLTGKTIYNIRHGFDIGRDVEELIKYYDKLDPSVIEKLSDFLLLNIDISKVDFTIVPTNLVDIVGKGLYQGYPMWLIVEEGMNLSEGKIKLLMKGMKLGIDVHIFLDSAWNEKTINLILSYVNRVNINDFLKYVNHLFSYDCVEVLLDLASEGVSINKLSSKDTDGYPIFNNYQMYELGEALKVGIDEPKMFDVNLSDMEMSLMREKILDERKKL